MALGAGAGHNLESYASRCRIHLGGERRAAAGAVRRVASGGGDVGVPQERHWATEIRKPGGLGVGGHATWRRCGQGPHVSGRSYRCCVPETGLRSPESKRPLALSWQAPRSPRFSWQSSGFGRPGGFVVSLFRTGE